MTHFIKGKHGAFVPKKITEAYSKFSSEMVHNEFFLCYVVLLDDHLTDDQKDKALSDLIQAMSDENNPVNSYFISKLKNDFGKELFNPDTYEQYFSQMAFARSVDNFITYLKEILAEVAITKPEILKSKDQEKLDFILSFDSIEELRIAIAEKKVEELFYKGINDIEKYFNEKLGIDIFLEDGVKDAFNLIVKQRNLIVHNRGVVSKEFIKEFPNYEKLLKTVLSFTYVDISKLNLALNNHAVNLDNIIAEKFKLKRLDNVPHNLL